MNQELHSLVTKYKTACLELEEIHAKVETVQSSHSTAAKKEETDEKLSQIISKLKSNVDTVLSKRLAETTSAKSAVQSYIDTTVWSLFSRTELQNNTLLFNNDQKRKDDKKRLYKLIATLFALDQEQVDSEDYKAQLHDWIIHISTIYLRLGGTIEKHKVLALLTATADIGSWAMPLIHIQADKLSQADDVLQTLDAIFIQPAPWTWTEDDFLVALDQLAIDFSYSRLMDAVDPDQQVSLESISILLLDAIAEKGWECQDQVDDFMRQLIFGFYDLKENGGWFFLPNIPFKALSIHALWLVTVRMLQLKECDAAPPTALSDVLYDRLPNITRFQYQLHDNQTQGYFMLNCLTNMATCIPPGMQLAKYILQHLNYGYQHDAVDPNVSKAQPWHSRKLPFLSYDLHEEIAFILLDACQQFQPLPDTTTNENKGAIELVGTVTTATTNNNNTASNVIQWAWSVAVQLKLYDCPVSPRASDIEQSITLPFLKLVLNSYNNVSSSHSALLVYISFMLSVTSRHFLRFECNDGWMKLLVMLKRGKPEAVIRILSDMIPSFVYMHGDDFFNDESLSDFLKHMIELKTDPTLIKAASRLHKELDGSGIGLMIGSHVWHAHLIDSVSDLMDDQGKGFSYVDLVVHSWLKTVFRKADWMWHSGYVHMVDHLCKCAFVLYRHGMVRHMLLEEHKRMEAAKVQQSASSPRLTRFIKNMVVSDGGPYASLLNGEWSMLKPAKGPGVEQHHHWFAFEVLVMETMREAPFREELCALITKQLQKKPVDYLAIYRWVQHIMTMPVHHPLLPLYLQMFFSLYYLNIHGEVTLGFVCFHKRADWTTKLRDYIASVQTYYGQKITTVEEDHDASQDIEDGSGHTAVSAEVLQQAYYAMWLWLGNADLNRGLAEDAVEQLPSHYLVHRLKSCYANKTELEQPWHHTDDYWMDLVDTEQLEQAFLGFPWEGSEKFRTEESSSGAAAAASITTADDLISLSTTTRRLRLITDESTIEPLPPLVINTPSTSTSTSSIKKKMNLK
ncbi:hypothetical protein FB192DRAFT_1277778 [Mucor lusitanicus]|uniref:Epg5-like TPR domain-containing protein n=1 Tax=Mucor circinelloides f. lusitanicus TaxID=29924 RepID=A0A8H4F366_MUCCL|nr:hypothetical protein FB192DRAFT_1277778 [Mucor lusitanicus]